jgi:hypothetical protein
MAERSGIVYITAIPQVSLGEVVGASKIDGMPVIFLEDDDGEYHHGGPYQIVLSVRSAKFLVCGLVDAIAEQERRHPELAAEMDCDGYDVECVDDGESEGDENGM